MYVCMYVGAYYSSLLFFITRMKEKLMAVAQEQALADFNQIKGDVVEATFGQQIRNYVFAPYKMVKDTRTGYETSQVWVDITHTHWNNTYKFMVCTILDLQVQDVMDGELDGFIAAYLRTSVEGRKSKSSSSDDSDTI